MGLHTNCSWNKLKELNINNLINLKKLYCYNNKLDKLHINNLINLNLLNCQGNNIKIIVFSNKKCIIFKDDKTILISQKEYEKFLKIKDELL